MKTIIKSNGLFLNHIPFLALTLLIVGLLAGTGEGFAQTLPGVRDSIVQITAESRGLPRLSPDQLPPFGTFWEVLPMPGGCVTMPLPCPPDNAALPVYEMADGQYLVDDTVGSGTSGALTEAALLAQADAVVNLISQVQTRAARAQARAMGLELPPSPGAGGDDGDGSGGCGLNTPSPVFTTNQLWLQLVTVRNQTASLVIHPPWNVTNQVYELLYSTNLLAPPTNWQWVLRSYPNETNLMVPNATDTQGFYRLREPGDLVANSSLGTNFWVGFFFLASHDGANALSLSISSSVGATGTVVTPGLLMNGPIVVVTNCGDGALNGTYVLTNLTAQEQSALGRNNIPSDSPSYVKGTNWVVTSSDCYLIAYDNDRDIITILYTKPGANANGTTNEWQGDADTNSPPATICNLVPMVNQFFTVAAGAVTNILLPLAAMLDAVGPNDLVEANGIHVTASQPVAVYALDYDQYVTAAFTSYPTTLLGTNYCILARPAHVDTFESQLAILATEDNTTVWITPSPTADLVNHADVYQTNLQAGEIYENRYLYDNSDITGTWIKSDKPIAVLAGANEAYVPDVNTRSGNPLVQEQLPVESWGKQVLALSFAGRTNGDSYRILAAYDNTVVTITGKVVTIVDEPAGGLWTVTTSNEVVVATITNAGEFYDIIVDGPVEFQASQPIQVAQFANGTWFDHAFNPIDPNSEGDCCEILLPPVGHYLNTNIVVTLPNDGVAGDFDENYLNIIVVQSAIANTLVNGVPVAATNFVAIGTSGYFGAQISVTNRICIVTSSQPVEVEVYGFGPADAYGYFGSVVK